MADDMIKITGLWKGKDKKGNPYFSGYMGNAKVLIFKNTYKEKDNQPDYNMFIAPKKEQAQGSGGVAPDSVVANIEDDDDL